MTGLLYLLIFIVCFIFKINTQECAQKKQFHCQQNSTELNCGNFIISGLHEQSSSSISKIIYENVTIHFLENGGSIENGYCLMNQKIFKKIRKRCYFFTKSENSSLSKLNGREIKCSCFFPQVSTISFYFCENTSRSAKMSNDNQVTPIPWHCNITYTALPKMQRIEILIKQCEEELKSLYVNLFLPNNKENNCTKKDDGRKINETKLQIMNGVASHTFDNLNPANFCVNVFPCPTWQFEGSSSAFLSLQSTEVNDIAVIESSVRDDIDTNDTKGHVVKIVCGVVIAFAVLVVLIYLSLKLTNRRKTIIIHEVNENIIEELQPRKKVFIIFNLDNVIHKKAVELVAQMLDECFNCEVSWGSNKDINEILKNRVGFITKNLKYSDKILFIHSEEAYNCYHNLLEKKEFKRNSVDDIFCETLNELLHDPRNSYDYKKVINVRFQNTSSEFIIPVITPNKHYVLPKQMEDIFYEIYELDPGRGKLLFKNYKHRDVEFQDIFKKIEGKKNHI